MVEYELMSSCAPGTVCYRSKLDGTYFIRYEIIRVADVELGQVVKG